MKLRISEYVAPKCQMIFTSFWCNRIKWTIFKSMFFLRAKEYWLEGTHLISITVWSSSYAIDSTLSYCEAKRRDLLRPKTIFFFFSFFSFFSILFLLITFVSLDLYSLAFFFHFPSFSPFLNFSLQHKIHPLNVQKSVLQAFLTQ